MPTTVRESEIKRNRTYLYYHNLIKQTCAINSGELGQKNILKEINKQNNNCYKYSTLNFIINNRATIYSNIKLKIKIMIVLNFVIYFT